MPIENQAAASRWMTTSNEVGCRRIVLDGKTIDFEQHFDRIAMGESERRELLIAAQPDG